MNWNKNKLSLQKGVVSGARALFLIAFSFILVYPILFMISNAVKTQTDTMNPAVQWLSRSPTLYGFQLAFMGMEYPKAFLHTVLYEVISAVIEVFTCSFYAYGLSRFKFRAKPVLMFLLIVTILVPDVVLLIPKIMNFRHMDFIGILGLIGRLTGVELRPNLTDTVWTFYLPSLLGVGLKSGLIMYIYIQFLKGLPYELEEAAWIDGAGPYRTFFRVILPSSGVVILTVLILSIIWHWNDWLLASMYTSENMTLAVTVKDISYVITRWAQTNHYTVSEHLKFGMPLAACLMFIFPPTAMYLILQKQFIQSIDRVGIVG